jgi:histidine triad (HIT) family protein
LRLETPTVPTIFTRIISGEIPCHRIYADEHVFAFLDIAPLSRGHALVVPREERTMLHELSEESAAALGRALPRVARAVMAATGATHYNILQNNGALAHQAVPHVHFHVIPRFADGSGLGIRWDARSLESSDGAALAARIAEAIASA